jgi:hypothetical protein
MTPRRQRLREDRQLRGLSERTQERSVRAVRPLADHDHPSPAQSTEEALRADFLSLKHVKHSARRASTMALCGITFFSKPPLKRDGTTLPCVRPPQAHTLPVILSLEEVHTLLPWGRWPRYRPCLPTIDACGLRLQAGTHVQIADMERARLLVPVRCGTGAQDRYGPLPSQTLEGLRQSWHPPPSPGVAFAGSGPQRCRDGHGLPPLPRHSVQDALRAARQASGIPTRASGHP